MSTDKAIRPWYKKKRVIIPAGLVALAIVAPGGSSSETESSAASGTAEAAQSNAKTAKSDNKAAEKKAAEKKAAEKKAAEKKAAEKKAAEKKAAEVATVGQAVTNAGTTYKVTSVKTTKTIGDPDFLGERADGTFVIVNLELTNNKDETKTFMDSNAKLKTSDGKEYETSDKAVLAFGDDSLMLKDIQPDLTTHGKLAFEIPPSKVSGSTIEIEDLWGSGEIKVDLGQ